MRKRLNIIGQFWDREEGGRKGGFFYIVLRVDKEIGRYLRTAGN